MLQYSAGDMEFKQNRFLPAEKQMVTANPDINTVSLFMCDTLNRLTLPQFHDCNMEEPKMKCLDKT